MPTSAPIASKQRAPSFAPEQRLARLRRQREDPIAPGDARFSQSQLENIGGMPLA